ncbi:hypothetical protein RF11_07297 [Thelohanellus kitauei]|uniref:Uncharacterized protein n=1 Tax=Thelohanellus kitauei TaxID=669202 RepID=A0A0C2N017_THEKT|nr:hypothetical protein RF11_07297 [Thelohanellus kitauei]
MNIGYYKNAIRRFIITWPRHTGQNIVESDIKVISLQEHLDDLYKDVERMPPDGDMALIIELEKLYETLKSISIDKFRIKGIEQNSTNKSEFLMIRQIIGTSNFLQQANLSYVAKTICSDEVYRLYHDIYYVAHPRGLAANRLLMYNAIVIEKMPLHVEGL